jgi:hypothetical protein
VRVPGNGDPVEVKRVEEREQVALVVHLAVRVAVLAQAVTAKVERDYAYAVQQRDDAPPITEAACQARAGGRRVGLFLCLCGQVLPVGSSGARTAGTRARPPRARIPHALAVARDWVAMLAGEPRLPGGGQVLDPGWLGIGRTPRRMPRIGDHAVESPATQLVNLRKTSQ